MGQRARALLGIGVLLTSLATAVPAPGRAAEKIGVCVSVLPQSYFVSQIGGRRVAVQVMVAPGASPATYEPKPRQMAALAQARIYFAIGVAFEQAWLAKIAAAHPEMQIVPTDQGIEKRAMARHTHPDHGDGHGDLHASPATAPAETSLDPHIWLSPPLVKIQARTILTALQAHDPPHAASYESNYLKFIEKIDELDAELKEILSGTEGMRFMVFHPAWGYFAQTYGLHQIPIEVEGKAPKPAQLNALIRRAREIGIRLIFAQPQFSTKSAALIAREIGGEVVFADPLAEDWPGNLRQIAVKFRSALK